MSLKIWYNGNFKGAQLRALTEGTRAHQLILADDKGKGSPSLTSAQADVALGQPPVAECLNSQTLRWAQVITAGYTRYDTPEFRDNFRRRGVILTTSSQVFADPCSQHILAMMLALSRQLLPSYDTQLGNHAWPQEERRYASTLLTAQTALFLGFGAIGHRLAELLQPFHMKIYAVRRTPGKDKNVEIISEQQLETVLPLADHVIDILPENASTQHFVNARRISLFKPGAKLYNVGRGTTIDQAAVLESLKSGHLGHAYLDVFEPEPLPVDHPLWKAPRSFVTPHSAGGRFDQQDALVKHFLHNLAAFERGDTMVDRII